MILFLHQNTELKIFRMDCTGVAVWHHDRRFKMVNDPHRKLHRTTTSVVFALAIRACSTNTVIRRLSLGRIHHRLNGLTKLTPMLKKMIRPSQLNGYRMKMALYIFSLLFIQLITIASLLYYLMVLPLTIQISYPILPNQSLSVGISSVTHPVNTKEIPAKQINYLFKS